MGFWPNLSGADNTRAGRPSPPPNSYCEVAGQPPLEAKQRGKKEALRSNKAAEAQAFRSDTFAGLVSPGSDPNGVGYSCRANIIHRGGATINFKYIDRFGSCEMEITALPEVCRDTGRMTRFLQLYCQAWELVRREVGTRVGSIDYRRRDVFGRDFKGRLQYTLEGEQTTRTLGNAPYRPGWFAWLVLGEREVEPILVSGTSVPLYQEICRLQSGLFDLATC